MYLPEPQQKLGFRRIWNLWELLSPGSLALFPRAVLKQLDDLKQIQTTTLNIIRPSPTPIPPISHPYDIRALWFTLFPANKKVVDHYNHDSWGKLEKSRKKKQVWWDEVLNSVYVYSAYMQVIFKGSKISNANLTTYISVTF